MASTKSGFQEIFLTYKDIHEAAADWPDRLIEDYLSLKRDLALTADNRDGTQQQADENTTLIASLSSDAGKIRAVNNKQSSDISGVIQLLSSLDIQAGKARASSAIQVMSIGELQTLFASIRGDAGKLRAVDNFLAENINNTNQEVAALQMSIGKLFSLVSVLLQGKTYIEVDDDYVMDIADRVIYADATTVDPLTVTFPDPRLVTQEIVIMNVTGSAADVDFATAAGTIVGTTTIGDQTAAVFEPRASATQWRES